MPEIDTEPRGELGVPRLMKALHWLALGGLFAIAPTCWGSDSLRTPHVELHLEADGHAAPGDVVWAGLRFELAPHWHVYWRNPGDSGEPPRARWQLPDGWQAGAIHWPVPQRIPVGPLVNYGYEHRVTLLVPLSVPSDWPRDAGATIRADLDWLVCREECIPESGQLSLDLAPPDAARPDAPIGRFEAVRGRLPVDLAGAAGYRDAGDGTLQLRFADTGWQVARIEDLWFAADHWGPVAASQPQAWRFDGNELVLSVGAGDTPPDRGDPLSGLLVMTEQTADGPLTRGYTVSALPIAPGADTAPSDHGVTLPLALMLAFLGGVLLNLMPCVLPVLAIKVLGLVRHAGHAAARHGLVFGAGVLVSFLALAGLLIALRAGGDALGWGFQLQQPWVVVALLYLMLAIALNLSGVYALGGRLTGIGQGLADRPGMTGTFATGVLAVIVASPCTAPFMGTALGYGLTRPPGEALLVFAALGMGFALPVLLLSIWPGWLSHLPRPGPWMERLRNALAFPMYAAAAWLLWVLSQQVTAPSLALALAGTVLLAFALWWYGQPWRHRRHQAVVAITLLGASLALGSFATEESAPIGTTASTPWSPERLAALRAQGSPVLVNFTAAWCITCKVNERVAFTERVRRALDEQGIAYLTADWTRRDALIATELQRHGRSGVPLYLLYPAGPGEPAILPQLLTEGLVLQAINDHQQRRRE